LGGSLDLHRIQAVRDVPQRPARAVKPADSFLSAYPQRARIGVGRKKELKKREFPVIIDGKAGYCNGGKTMRFAKKLISLWLGIILVVCVSAMPLSAADPTEAGEPSPDEVAADLLFIRPIALCSIVVGSAIFVVFLPFTIPTGNFSLSGKKLVLEPVKYTFLKPLGELETPFRVSTPER
jgi:hypothetical protein